MARANMLSVCVCDIAVAASSSAYALPFSSLSAALREQSHPQTLFFCGCALCYSNLHVHNLLG